MMSPNRVSEDRGNPPHHFRQTPLQIIHIVANFMRIWSIYSMYRYFVQTGASVVLFLFACLAPASILFLILQKPWKGRPLSNTQVVPSIINGGITALYLVLWGKGLKSCGPARAILAEYSGAVLGVLSAVLYGRRAHLWKKGSSSESDNSKKLPFSAWAFFSTILFGNIVIFYADSIAEERLHMVFSSPRHLAAAGACIIIMENVYKMDFSLAGFTICCLILGFGIYEATSLERNRKDSIRNSDSSIREFDDPIQMSALPT
uniref:Uncharacterized protein n=1 Tax=Phaseolus vulgaris TaxID=3885 RepID=V7C451_PHAVU|nr:hypothetical protein PHAVU_004G065800g [Phaseolus vulgaris]ESW23661.1 hypothetical protein PHAVU_004G065800g [Phaseolus vulgaris]